MKTISVTDLSIALAYKNGELSLVKRFNERLGCSYVAVQDTKGTIEVHNTMAEAKARVSDIIVLVEEKL